MRRQKENIDMKKRTTTCILAAMMALSACLSGCSTGTSGSASASSGTQGTSSGESSDIIQLTYWYSWQDKIAENNVERIQEFNETVGKENGKIGRASCRERVSIRV